MKPGSFANLIERAFRLGDGDAFDTIFWRLFRHVYNQIKDFHAAEDIVVMSMRKIEQGYGELRDPNKAEGWCSRIASNTALDYLRKHGGVREISWEGVREQEAILRVSDFGSLPYITTIEDDVQRRETQRLVSETLDALPEPYRTCLILKFVYGLKLEKIAEIYNRDKRTVSRYIEKGSKKFREVYTWQTHL